MPVTDFLAEILICAAVSNLRSWASGLMGSMCQGRVVVKSGGTVARWEVGNFDDRCAILSEKIRMCILASLLI